jgi:hypothetical protein
VTDNRNSNYVPGGRDPEHRTAWKYSFDEQSKELSKEL